MVPLVVATVGTDVHSHCKQYRHLALFNRKKKCTDARIKVTVESPTEACKCQECSKFEKRYSKNIYICYIVLFLYTLLVVCFQPSANTLFQLFNIELWWFCTCRHGFGHWTGLCSDRYQIGHDDHNTNNNYNIGGDVFHLRIY